MCVCEGGESAVSECVYICVWFVIRIRKTICGPKFCCINKDNDILIPDLWHRIFANTYKNRKRM